MAFTARNGRPWAEQPLLRPLFGAWGLTYPEDVVVCRLSDSDVEIQCHGGDAAVRRILSDLEAQGIATVPAETQLRDQTNTLHVELQTALTHALTLRTADLLLEQTHLLPQVYQELADFDATPAARDRCLSQIDALLRWATFGRHLTAPWSVVLTGLPNVGKSSLSNALLGFQRAIVSDLPGTTRDVVTSLTAIDGWPVQFADTAGLRESADVLESAGIDRARRQLESADLRIIVIDVSRPAHADELQLLAAWPSALIVAHKVDLTERWGRPLPNSALRVSSQTGTGISELLDEIARRLVPELPAPGTPIPMSLRQIALLESAYQSCQRQDYAAYQRSISQLTSQSPPEAVG